MCNCGRVASPLFQAIQRLCAGAGMAGLEAAITLKQRGHTPIIVEESNLLGGQFLLAGQAPRKEEIKKAALSRGKQAQDLGIDIRLNTKATTAVLEEISPDAVIVATGGEPAKLNVQGANLPHVVNSFDVLEGKVVPSGSKGRNQGPDKNGCTGKGYWRVAGSGILSHTLTDEYPESLSYVDIAKRFEVLHLSY